MYSHGLSRVRMVRSGIIDVNAQPRLVAACGGLARWEGTCLNASHSMDRAIAVSRRRGIGPVALARTNHWMRGRAYGWQAAEASVTLTRTRLWRSTTRFARCKTARAKVEGAAVAPADSRQTG